MTEPNRQPDATDEAVSRAQELGVDLATVQGTGADGRILVKDVEDAHEQDVNSERQDSDYQNRDVEEAAETFWKTFVRLEQSARAVETREASQPDPSPDIIKQYNILRRILASPFENLSRIPEEDFPPNPDKDFAPQKPLADWKPLKREAHETEPRGQPQRTTLEREAREGSIEAESS